MGGSAPKPDAQIGIAALKSAETGQQMLDWMRDQAEVTNAWAGEDRERWESVFRPLQDRYIAEAASWDSAGRKDARATEAVADDRNDMVHEAHARHYAADHGAIR